MALEIKYDKIVGTIDNLQEKLNGELPINGLELLYLVNSWGRTSNFNINENIQILECEATQSYDLSKLDTSEITDMEGLFRYSMFNDIHSTNGIGLHNGDISNWDVSKVTNMGWMFMGASNFNQTLNNWDVSNVTDMSVMFYNTNNFNQPLNNWDVSNVTDMEYMFEGAKSFNQALNTWDVSNVTNMREMFQEAEAFNQALNNWDVSNVTDMNYMFRDASNFNQALNNWNTSNVRDMRSMFNIAIAFKTKFNNGNSLPNDTNDLKQWLKENRDMMLAIDIKEREKDRLDSFFNNLDNINNDIDSTQSEQAELVRKECNLIK